MPTCGEWAYLAGILDGEGSICLHKDGRDGRIWGEMSIYNTSSELVKWIEERFGGRIYRYDTRKKDMMVIRWNGEKSKELIPHLLPYLIIKQEKALSLLALAEVSSFRGNGKRDREAQEMIYAMARKKTGKALAPK